MTRKDIITYICFALLFLIGIYLGGFAGGFVAGITFTMVLLMTVGRRQLASAASRIDKQIHDNILQTQMQNDGNETA